jgi:hypothetical protein
MKLGSGNWLLFRLSKSWLNLVRLDIALGGAGGQICKHVFLFAFLFFLFIHFLLRI